MLSPVPPGGDPRYSASAEAFSGACAGRPVLVQGESVAEITAAIDGFDALSIAADGMSHGLPTPDVLIIARGVARRRSDGVQ